MKDELVEVTQADRDAAADFADAEARLWSMGNGSAHSGPMRRGERDDTLTVQAFARHRLSSSPVEEAPADVALLVARLREGMFAPAVGPLEHNTTNEAAALITRLSADLADARKVIEQIKDTVQYVDNPYAKDAYWLARQWLSQQGDQS